MTIQSHKLVEVFAIFRPLSIFKGSRPRASLNSALLRYKHLSILYHSANTRGTLSLHGSLQPVRKMSDDEADPELLALLRQALMGKPMQDEEPETGVLEGAEYVCDNSIDVALDMRSTKVAAGAIYNQMQQKNYSPSTWSDHELHPKSKDEATVAFIFLMDLLNFSFWSEKPESERFAVSYRDRRWTGYWSLVASIQRALDEGWCISYLPHMCAS